MKCLMLIKERVMETLPRVPVSVSIALAGVMTALVCVATVAFQAYFPLGGGYINAGEGVIYVTALLFGPIIGGVAGGVGSMLADILLGFTQYAPAALLIKGAEGLVVGFVGYKFRLVVRRWWKPLNMAMCFGIAGLVLYMGVKYLSGLAEISGGLRPWWWSTLFVDHFEWGWWIKLIDVPWWIWLIASLYIGLLILYLGSRVDASTGWSVLSILIGGLCLVAGCFLYDQLFLGVVATSTVFNVAQILLGVMIAVPVEAAMRKLTPEILVKCEREDSTGE